MRQFAAKVLLLIGVIAAPAESQDGSEQAMNRTPANAQKFLAAYPPRMIQIRTGTETTMLMREGEVTSSDACTTLFTGFPARQVDGAWVKGAAPRVVNKTGIGITYTAADEQQRQKHRLPEGIGLVVASVAPGSAAERAGITQGMIISHVMKQDATVDRLDQTIASAKIGSKLYVGIIAGTSAARFLQLPVIEQTVTYPVQDQPMTIGVVWSRIEQVSIEDGIGVSNVVLHTPGDMDHSATWLIYPMTATRDRVLSAAQYLQQACDRTKELGF